MMRRPEKKKKKKSYGVGKKGWRKISERIPSSLLFEKQFEPSVTFSCREENL